MTSFVAHSPDDVTVYMSTTLTVLHVLLSSDNDAVAGGKGLLMTSPENSASLMTSRSSVLGSLDPLLVDFWSGFPCPPPWNTGLLFRSE